MTPQQEKNIPKEGEFDGHVALGGERAATSGFSCRPT